MRWLFFILLAASSRMLRFLDGGMAGHEAGSALLALGCLILGGFLAGDLAERFRLPRVTGYLLLGMVAGPYALGLESHGDAEFLRLFEELALGLIALTAGGESQLSSLKKKGPLILGITGAHILILPLAGAALWLFFSSFPVLGPLGSMEILAASALLGTIAVAKSPSTTIAVITEMKARGPVTETVLSVIILTDMVILLLFTGVNVMAHAWVEGSAIDLHLLTAVLLEIVFSFLLGAVLGFLLGFYMKRIGLYLPLVVLALALISIETANSFQLEHLLICMVAGFIVRNVFPKESSVFLEALELSSPPVYIIFFALVGAGLDLGVLAVMWFPALIFVSLRMGLTWVLTRIPAGLAGAGDAVRRRAWMGFIAQAGLSLGLAARIQREMPEFGSKVALLIIAAVVINQLIGPVFLASALKKSGECGWNSPPRRPVEEGECA